MSNVGKRGKLKLETRLRAALLNGTNTRLEHHEIERVIQALSKPQAREEAQPVDCYDCATDRPHLTTDACTPTAPEAEKLRVAVEALGEVSALRSNGHGDEWESGFTQATIRAADIADQALAALQGAK